MLLSLGITAYFLTPLFVCTIKWKFTSAIKNCPETAIIMVALYSDDRMVGLSEITDISNEVSKDLYVNKCTFEKAKVFIWESLETLVPISVAEEISYE